MSQFLEVYDLFTTTCDNYAVLNQYSVFCCSAHISPDNWKYRYFYVDITNNYYCKTICSVSFCMCLQLQLCLKASSILEVQYYIDKAAYFCFFFFSQDNYEKLTPLKESLVSCTICVGKWLNRMYSIWE